MTRPARYVSISSGRPRIIANGFACACLRAAMATLPKCSRFVPNSCMCRCAHMPMTSTGRMRPHGVCSALSSRTSSRSCAHGRDPLAPRLRARWQATTVAMPVATAAAACISVALDAPPPYEILSHQVSWRTPSRRAMETSWVASISSIDMPSRSSPSRPASSRAIWMASTAVSEIGRPMSFANGKWPIPTTATLSWMRRKRSRSKSSVGTRSA